MSGHSKWHNIQARKGKQDARKGNVFSKYAKQISITAKNGSGDPAANFSLRLLIDKAKAAGMPKDNIERAIKRGTGEDGAGVQMEESLYEAYGPGGVAIMVKTITDNKNRTTADIKHIINSGGGIFGNSGSVNWMFENCGLIIINQEQLEGDKKISRDDLEMKMMEAGVDDIWEEDGLIYFKVKLVDYKRAVDTIKDLGIEMEKSSLEWVAKDKIKVDAAVEEKLKKLFSALEENDDVEDYYTNAE